MIQDKNGRAIVTMEDWAEIYASGNKAKHWKEGRSAYSIADYVLNHNGLDRICHRVEEIIQEPIKFEKVIPELKIKFDTFRQGRVHDLGIYGDNPSIFIGVESKVDEPFGQTISDSYLDSVARSISGENTKKPQRIYDLLKKQFRKPDRTVFDLRYQLLYAVSGTIAAKKKISVLYIIAFKTNLYDDLLGIDNYRDYISFMKAVNAIEQKTSRPDSIVHKLKLGRKELISIYDQIEWKLE